MSDSFNKGSGRLPKGLRSRGKRNELPSHLNAAGHTASVAPHSETTLNLAQQAAQNAGFELEIDYAAHTVKQRTAARDDSAAPQATGSFHSSDFNLAEGRARLGIERSNGSEASAADTPHAAQAAGPSGNEGDTAVTAPGNSAAQFTVPAPEQPIDSPVGAAVVRPGAPLQPPLTAFSVGEDDKLAAGSLQHIPDLGPADDGMPQNLKQASLQALSANPIMANRLAARAPVVAPSPVAEPAAKTADVAGHAGAGTEAMDGEDPDLIPIRTSLRDEEVPNQPGAILRHAREMLGLSQREIAMRLKLQVNSISDIEHDRLNQPTAAAFARGHIANYARLVNIDPKIVVELYDENVAALKAQAALNTQRLVKKQRKGSSHAKRYVYSAIFVAIAAGLGINYIYSSQPTEEPVTEALVIAPSADASGTLSNDAASADSAEVSGSLTMSANDTSPAEGTAAASAAASVQPVDLNTLRAQEQAAALGTNELTEEDLPHRATVDSTAPLLTTAEPAAQAPQKLHSGQQPSADGATSAPSSSALNNSSTSADAKPSQSATARPEAASSSRPAQGGGSATPALIVDNQQNGTEGSLTLQEPAPALASTLQDVSSRVSVRNRDGLASLNSASVSVRGKVYLRITDSRGKVLAYGNYDAGEQVRVTGIPPIKVEVTDSSRISIAYMGGSLVMPQARQVSFTLPQR